MLSTEFEVRTPARTARALRAGAVGGAALLSLLLVEAGHYPGLQADEAWTGLAALHIRNDGVTTPHGMNEYTAPVLPWLVATVFDVTSPGVRTLRITTAVLAAVGFSFLVFGVSRNVGVGAARLFAALFFSCLLFTWYGRVAFEVIGLQDLLLGIVVATTLGFAASGRTPVLAVAGFLYAMAIGTASHFLFIVVAASFATASLLLALTRNDAAHRKLLGLAFVNLVLVGGVVVGKLGLGTEQFVRHRSAILAGFLAAPLAATVMYRFMASAMDKGTAEPLSRLSGRPRIVGVMWVVTGVGLVYAFAHHGVALIQIYSSIPVMQRLASFTPPIIAQIPLYAWGGILSVATLGTVLAVGTPSRCRALEPVEALLALWFVAALVWLAVAATENSIRYYRIPLLFAFLAIAVRHTRRPTKAVGLVTALVLIPAVALNAFALRETTAGSRRSPIEFEIGSLEETSTHFISLDGVVEAMRRDHVCRYRAEYFIEEPIRLLYALDPWECDRERVVTLDYCRECSSPPFVRWDPVLE